MIRFPLKSKPRKFKGVLIGPGSGPAERIEYLKKLVTSLIRHERIEGRADRMHEARAYAEQLINLAIQHGDRHEATMKMADEWLLEKDLVHKLFKVLAPRYEKFSSEFSSVYLLPAVYPGNGKFEAVLELKGNPYPPVIPKQRETRHLLTNVLISAAGRDFYWSQKQGQTNSTQSVSENQDKWFSLGEVKQARTSTDFSNDSDNTTDQTSHTNR